jgi:predicted HTH domain antitoxin
MYRRAVTVVFPDEILAAAQMDAEDVRRELALALFRQERLTLAQARRLAGMSHLDFQALLAEREIPVHYGIEEWRSDVRTLREMGRL